MPPPKNEFISTSPPLLALSLLSGHNLRRPQNFEIPGPSVSLRSTMHCLSKTLLHLWTRSLFRVYTSYMEAPLFLSLSFSLFVRSFALKCRRSQKIKKLFGPSLRPRPSASVHSLTHSPPPCSSCAAGDARGDRKENLYSSIER